MKTYTKPEIVEVLAEVLEINRDTFNRWLSRGDGIAVYENTAMDSYACGHRQFASFGSPAAQIESPEPPSRMPDIGHNINWKYQLVGTYKGETL